jgi:hypothetical protein
MSEVTEIPRHEDVKKLDDPKYHERMNWIDSLEKDYPSVPYYFLDLITSYCQSNPEEAEKIMNGEIVADANVLHEWKKSVKECDKKDI